MNCDYCGRIYKIAQNNFNEECCSYCSASPPKPPSMPQSPHIGKYTVSTGGKYKIKPIRVLSISETMKYCGDCGSEMRRIASKTYDIGTGKETNYMTNWIDCPNCAWSERSIPHIHECECGKKTATRGCHGWMGCGNCNETCLICGDTLCTNIS